MKTLAGRLSLGAAVVVLTLAGCGAYGPGIAELPAAQGWARLPVQRWLLNEGLRPTTLVMCPRATCDRPSVVATFEAEGAVGRDLEKALADDKLLTDRPEKPPANIIGGGKPREPKVKSVATTIVERFAIDGLQGVRVTLTPDVTKSDLAATNHAVAVILSRRLGETFKLAFSVTTDGETALAQARSAARSW